MTTIHSRVGRAIIAWNCEFFYFNLFINFFKLYIYRFFHLVISLNLLFLINLLLLLILFY